MEIAEIIRDLRERSGLTQERLAESVGLYAPAISRWECGKAVPTIGLLERVLQALQATSQERLTALQALDAPRGRAAVAQLTACPLPDAAGELWRVLRLRSGLSLTEVADALGVEASTVSRWEKGGATPSAAATQGALRLFEATAPERTALSGEKRSLARPGFGSLTVEEYDREIARLRPLALHAEAEPVELALLVRMEELFRRADFDDRFRPLLADVYSLMGARMTTLGRARECLVWCDRGLCLVKPTGRALSVWAGLMFRKGYCLSRRRQVAHLSDMLDHLKERRDAQRRSQTYREMASAALALGHLRWAETWGESAREAADESGDGNFVVGSDLVWARVLTATGRAEEAMAFLPTVCDPVREEREPVPAAKAHLEWAKTLLACHEERAAEGHLGQFRRICETHRITSLHGEGERIARMLSALG